MIDVGQVVTTRASGVELRIEELIGEGGQGVVFRATPQRGSGKALAVKWYHPHTASSRQRATIDELLERGAPSRRFLWPFDVVGQSGHTDFGYVMPLRPARFRSLAELVGSRTRVGFAVTCRLSLELSHAFLQLHTQGLCYRDISFGNVFFDPADGAPLICDNDNVTVDGKGPATVLGTRRFMAPEIVRREADPSSATDLFSLAVLLFYILVSDHPLVGRREHGFECWDEHAESELFGHHPLFVFDPVDPSNAPDPSIHSGMLRSWELYPTFVRELFTQAFTTGLTDPWNGRVRESVWRAAAARLLDSIVRCATCRHENYQGASTAGRCRFCDGLLPAPPALVVGHHRIAVAEGAVLTSHHLLDDYDVFTAVGRIVAHPNRPDLLGLRNESTATWRGWQRDQSAHAVEPGRSFRLQPGARIELAPGRTVIVE